jgi:hypothetical protein
LRFQVGGRPGTPADLRIEAAAPAGGWFPGLPKAVTPGPDPVDVAFTPAAGTPGGTMGSFVGVLTEQGTNRTLARSGAIQFEVPVPAPRVDALVPSEIRREREEDTNVAARVRGAGLKDAQVTITRTFPMGQVVPWLAVAVNSRNDNELALTITVTGIGPEPHPDAPVQNFEEGARVTVRSPQGVVATGAQVVLRGIRWVT